MLDSLWNSLDGRGRVLLCLPIVLIGLVLWTLLLALVTAPEAAPQAAERHVRGVMPEVREQALLKIRERHEDFDEGLVGGWLVPPACRRSDVEMVCDVRFPVGSRGELLVPVLVELEGSRDLLGRDRHEVTGHRLLRWGVALVLDNPG